MLVKNRHLSLPKIYNIIIVYLILCNVYSFFISIVVYCMYFFCFFFLFLLILCHFILHICFPLLFYCNFFFAFLHFFSPTKVHLYVLFRVYELRLWVGQWGSHLHNIYVYTSEFDLCNYATLEASKSKCFIFFCLL